MWDKSGIGNSKEFSLHRDIITPLLVVLLITAAGLLYIIDTQKRFHTHVLKDMESVSEYKVWLIENWKEERLSDLQVISASQIITDNAYEWVAGNDISYRKNLVINYFEEIIKAYSYEDIILTTPTGEVILGTDTISSHVDPSTEELIRRAITGRDYLFSDFYHCKLHNKMHLDLIAPVYNTDGILFGSLILRIDPTITLYPIIRQRQTGTPLLETVIIRDNFDGTYTVINRDTSAEQFGTSHVPSTEESTISIESAALNGIRGFFTGPDHNGNIVTGTIHHIQSTNWLVITSTSLRELNRQAREESRSALLIIASMIIIVALYTAYRYKSKTKSILRLNLKQERELRIAESRFRIILYSIGDGVITTDTRGVVKEMNRIAEQLTGWTEGEAAGRKLDEVFVIVNEYTRMPVTNPVDKVLREGVIVGLANHTILISRDGREIPIADSGAPIHDSKGVIDGVVLVFRDQIEEREMERKLLEREKRVADIINSAPFGALTYELTPDNELILRHVNQSAYRILGKETGSLAGLTIEKAFPGLADTEIPTIYRRVAATGEEYTNTHVHYDHNGITGTYEIQALRTGKNRMTVFFRDITETTRAEAEREEARRRLTTLIGNLPGIAYRCRYEKKWTMEFISEGCYEITGYRDNELTGNNVIAYGDLILPEYRDYVWKNITESVRNEGTFELNYPVRRRDGSIRWAWEQGAAIKENNQIIAIEGFIADVTENRELIEELKEAKEKAEEMNRLKSAFLANMSHELRTPMNGIMGFSELLLSEGDVEEKNRMSGFINKSAGRLMQTLNNILDISRIESGVTKPYIKEVKINELIAESVELFRAETTLKGVSLNFSSTFDKEHAILTDPIIVNDIVTNLVNNAVKFTEKGGVDVRLYNNLSKEQKDHLTIEVADTGIGISEKDKELIFQEFRQASEGDSRKYEGTGLGLTICKKYATLLGGSVSVESQLGKGSVFRVVLPCD